MHAYIEWAQAITPEHRVMLWGAALLGVVLCIALANWDELISIKPPDDPQPPDRMNWN